MTTTPKPAPKKLIRPNAKAKARIKAKPCGAVDVSGRLIATAQNLEALAAIMSMQMMERSLTEQKVAQEVIIAATDKTMAELIRHGFDKDDLEALYEYNLSTED